MVQLAPGAVFSAMRTLALLNGAYLAFRAVFLAAILIFSAGR